MFSETFKDENGVEKTVYASDEKELKEAVEKAKNTKGATYPNINVPLPKGKDLLSVDEALNVETVDGRGAHNSPRDAVRDDLTLEGDPTVASPGAGEAPLKQAGTGQPVGEAPIEKPAEGDEDSDAPEKVEKFDEKALEDAQKEAKSEDTADTKTVAKDTKTVGKTGSTTTDANGGA